MRFSDLNTAQGIAQELDRRLACTTSGIRRRKIIRAAANAMAALAGISLAEPNLADDAMSHAIELSALEDARHSGADNDAFDDRLHPIVHRTDNLNPAAYDYDQPAVFTLPDERQGWYWTQPPGMREKRREPVKVRKVELTPPGYFSLVSYSTGANIPTTYDAPPPPPVKPVPAVNRKGDRLTPPPAIVAEQAAAAVVRLMEAPAPERMTWEEDAESTLSQVGSLPEVGRYRKLRYDNDTVIVERISHDTCRVTAIA